MLKFDLWQFLLAYAVKGSNDFFPLPLDGVHK